MKVFHIAGGGDRGGAKPHIFSLLKALGESGTLLSMRSGEFCDEAAACGINTRLFYSRFVPADFLRLVRFVRREKPDIVHCHGTKANVAGALVRLFCPGVKTVSTVHSDWKLDYMHSFVRRITLGTLNALALRRFDYWITVSESFKEMMIKRGFPPQRIMTIYNGIDFSVISEKFDRGAWLRSLGLDYTEGDVVLGILARLSPVKDVPTLIKAFSEALRENPRLRLLIGGEGEEEKKLAAMAESLGLSKKICFCGWVTDVRRFFGACDIDVLCSISESFPYSVLEGVREGCAVITSNVGGMKKLVTSGENGYIFEPGDAFTLKKYILELAEDRDKRRLFALRLYKKASAEYSVEAMGRTQLEIYERIKALRPFDRSKRVVVCGAYGRGNTGDESILRVIVKTLRTIDPGVFITVMTRKPRETRVTLGVDAVYTFDFPGFRRAMRKAALYINGGGSLIQDTTSSRSLRFYLYTIKTARALGCRVLMYGSGIGRVTRPGNREATRKVLSSSVDVITLRDPMALSELESLGVSGPEVKVTADPVINLPSASPADTRRFMEKCGLPADKKYIAFCLRRWPGADDIRAYARAAEYAYRTYGLTAIFLPVEVPADCALSRQAADMCATPHYVIDPPAPAEGDLMIGLFKNCGAVVGMRLHSLIFAAAAGVPSIAASYDVKVDGFMDYVGASRFCKNVGEITPRWLMDAIDDAVTEGRVNADICSAISEKERENARVLAGFLEEKS